MSTYNICFNGEIRKISIWNYDILTYTEGTDQTVWMNRLIWAFTVLIYHKGPVLPVVHCLHFNHL